MFSSLFRKLVMSYAKPGVCVSLMMAMVCLGALPALGADAPVFTPGEVTTIHEPGYRGFYLVYLPSNYDPRFTWPVILSYHGYQGQPSIHPFREVTDGRHFIVVGMDYVNETFHKRIGKGPVDQELKKCVVFSKRLTSICASTVTRSSSAGCRRAGTRPPSSANDSDMTYAD